MSQKIKAIGFDANGVLIQNGELSVEIVELVQKLHASGYKLGVLSNAMGLEISEMESLFEGLPMDYKYYSSRESAAKPEPQVFSSFAHKLGVQDSELLIIDDSPRIVHGARFHGIQAIHYTSMEELQSDLERFWIRF